MQFWVSRKYICRKQEVSTELASLVCLSTDSPESWSFVSHSLELLVRVSYALITNLLAASINSFVDIKQYDGLRKA